MPVGFWFGVVRSTQVLPSHTAAKVRDGSGDPGTGGVPNVYSPTAVQAVVEVHDTLFR